MFIRPASELPHPRDPDARDNHQLSASVVAGLVSIVLSDVPHMPNELALELRAFAESRTVADARRVANSLRHHYGRPGIAQEFDDALSD